MLLHAKVIITTYDTYDGDHAINIREDINFPVTTKLIYCCVCYRNVQREPKKIYRSTYCRRICSTNVQKFQGGHLKGKSTCSRELLLPSPINTK